MAQPPAQEPEISLWQQLINAYSRMRTGIMFFFISWLLLVVAIFIGLGAIWTAIGFGGPHGPGEGMEAMIAAAASIGIVALIALVIQLIGLFAKFIPGARDLAEADFSFSTASKLIRTGYAWGMSIMLIVLIIILAAAVTRNIGAIWGALGLAIIGGILGFIGYIGIIVLQFQLHSKEKDSLYLAAGVFFILFFIPYLGWILQMIAWILFYVALGRSIERLKLQLSPPGISAQPL